MDLIATSSIQTGTTYLQVSIYKAMTVKVIISMILMLMAMTVKVMIHRVGTVLATTVMAMT